MEHRQTTGHDDTLDTADRVTAALVVLYAQPISRIVTLTSADVHTLDGTVTVALGPDRLELPEPFATLFTRLPHRRRGGAAHIYPAHGCFPPPGRADTRPPEPSPRGCNALGFSPGPCGKPP